MQIPMPDPPFRKVEENVRALFGPILDRRALFRRARIGAAMSFVSSLRSGVSDERARRRQNARRAQMSQLLDD